MKPGAYMPGWPLLLRRELAAAFLDVSVSTFDNWARDGLVPAPVALPGTVRRWHLGDLTAWAEDRRAAGETPRNEWTDE